MASTHGKASRAKSANVDTLNTRITDEDIRDWARAAQETTLSRQDTVPAGWYTIMELKAKLGMGHMQTRQLVKQLQTEGRAEMRRFVTYINSRCYPTPYYKLKK